MSLARASYRERLLAAGDALLHERGYAASGVRDITEAAGVPLGSFTNHFRSKEAYAALILERYMEVLLAIVARTLQDASREPLDRITSYFDAIEEIAAPLNWRLGCMLANFGLEMPVHSEILRKSLATSLQRLTQPFAEAIFAAQQRGQARRDIDADDLPVVMLAGWHGALLRGKVDQSGDAPRRFARMVPLLLQGDGGRSAPTADVKNVT